ncbi:MAG: glycosyltransferase family 2 protein [Candidatus Pacebacteria bacterium]|nr:glycosyltransferase family 2 protein [Candidatus Paceibacterota bacterium]MDD5357039.1 glycosyltransferase family 2 protein [Candidatus Paceibacterota bacterium]
MNQKVSVLIPVYNGEETLHESLESVSNQAYDNYEVIVVDNNSKDRTKEIIYDFIEKYRNIKYVFELKVGRGAARNAGIREANGEVILMTDADCTVPKDWIEKMTALIRRGEESVIMGFEEDIIKNYWTKNIQDSNWNLIKENSENGYTRHLDTKNFAIKTSLMKELMFDETMKCLEDLEFYLRLIERSRIKLLDMIKVNHYHKSSGIGWSKVQIDRGYWSYKIYKKYRKKNNFARLTMFKSLSITAQVFFPFWLIFQMIRDPRRFPFVFVSEISWRVGTLKEMIVKNN